MMGWPQWTVAGLLCASVIMNAAADGTPKKQPNFCFASATMEAAIFALLLHIGGFWT